MASPGGKPNEIIDAVIASKVDQIKALPYATSIVAEDVIERNYGYKIIRQQVSSGRNSMIYKCQSVRYPDSYCLVKPYKLGRDKIKTTLREDTCQILRFVTAKSPLILSTYDLFYTNEKVYLMCDWSQKGELLNCLKSKSIRLTEEVVRQWTIDLLNAVQFLHSNAICHRNIAPSSLLLTGEDRVKIGSLSDAVIYCKSDGTLIKQKWNRFSREANWNQPPEVAKLKQFDPRRADMWSLGATIYWLICRTYPIDYRSGQRMTKQLDYRLSFLRKVSSKAQKFVKRMLTFQPPQRPSLQQALEMEWITAPARDRSTSYKPSTRRSTPTGPTHGAKETSGPTGSDQATNQLNNTVQPVGYSPTNTNSPELIPQPDAAAAAEPGDAAGIEESGAIGVPEQTVPENPTNHGSQGQPPE